MSVPPLGPKVVPPAPPAPGPNDWRVYTNPAFEINGLDQLRTRNLKDAPPAKPKEA